MESADDELLNGIHNVIYKATSSAFREYQSALEKYEKRRSTDLSSDCRLDSHYSRPLETYLTLTTSQNIKSKTALALHSDYPWLLPSFQNMG
jgi:hypothetical protein